MRVLKFTLLTTMVLALLAGSAFADRHDRKIKSHPGYVDFSAIELFEEEARVEVYLREPLLKLVGEAAKREDPELYDLLKKLKLVRVQIFDIDRDLARKVGEVTKQTAKELDEKGWERIVRVREDDERIDVYLKPSENYESIMGIVVMVVGDDDEAIFVNIVGEISPEDIGKLGDKFDIDELDDIDYDDYRKDKSNG